MKIKCICGELIHDVGDNLPTKGHVISDERWFDVFCALDEVITSTETMETKQTALRTILCRNSKIAYQCSSCGRLYFDSAENESNIYSPEGQASKRILSAKP